jgi:hypothetical protein
MGVHLFLVLCVAAKNPVLKPAKYLQGGTPVAQALLTVIFEVAICRTTFQNRLRMLNLMNALCSSQF